MKKRKFLKSAVNIVLLLVAIILTPLIIGGLAVLVLSIAGIVIVGPIFLLLVGASIGGIKGGVLVLFGIGLMLLLLGLGNDPGM